MYIKQMYSWTWSSLNNKKLCGNPSSNIKSCFVFFMHLITSLQLNCDFHFIFSLFVIVLLRIRESDCLQSSTSSKYELKNWFRKDSIMVFRCTFIIIKTFSTVPVKSFTAKQRQILYVSQMSILQEVLFSQQGWFCSTALNFGPRRSWTRICARKQKERSNSVKLDQSGSKRIKEVLAGRVTGLHVLVLVDHVVVVLQHRGDRLLILGHLEDTRQLRMRGFSFQGKIAPPCGERASLPPSKLRRRSSCHQQGRPRWGS